MSEGTGNPPPPPENPYGSGPGQTPPPGQQPPPPSGQQPPPPPPPGQSPGQNPGQDPGQPGQYGAAPGGYQPAPPPPPMGSRPGELLDRFLARLIDSVLLFVVNLVLLVPIMIAVLGIDGATGFGGVGTSFAAGAVTAVLSTLVYLGYFGFMESNQGRTVGKMVMKLRVVGSGGGNPSLEEALKRNIWMGLPILGVVPVIGGLVASLGQLAAVIMIAIGINNDPVERKPWTDKFAGTQVLKEG